MSFVCSNLTCLMASKRSKTCKFRFIGALRFKPSTLRPIYENFELICMKIPSKKLKKTFLKVFEIFETRNRLGVFLSFENFGKIRFFEKVYKVDFQNFSYYISTCQTIFIDKYVFFLSQLQSSLSSIFKCAILNFVMLHICPISLCHDAVSLREDSSAE